MVALRASQARLPAIVLLPAAAGLVGCGDQASGGGESQKRTDAVACNASPTRRIIEVPGSPGDIVAGTGPVLFGGGFVNGSAIAAYGVEGATGDVSAKLYFMLARRGPAVVTITGAHIDNPSDRVRFQRIDTRAPTVTLVLRRTSVARNGTRAGTTYHYQPNSITVSAPGCYQLDARWGTRGRSSITIEVPRPSVPAATGS